MIRYAERLAFAFMLACALVVLLLQEDAVLGIAGPRYNHSPSMPVGVYWFVPGSAMRGDVVAACLPDPYAQYALAHKILEPSRHPCANGVEPIVKSLAAVQGDVVDVGPQGVRINGVLWPMSVVRRRNCHGQREVFRVPPGRHIVAPDKEFLLGLHPCSWDGRYIGDLPRASIVGAWYPILTFN